MEVLKVSAKSSPNSVAGALAGVLRERGGAEIQAIGAKLPSIKPLRRWLLPGFCSPERNGSGLRAGFHRYSNRGGRADGN